MLSAPTLIDALDRAARRGQMRVRWQTPAAIVGPLVLSGALFGIRALPGILCLLPVVGLAAAVAGLLMAVGRAFRARRLARNRARLASATRATTAAAAARRAAKYLLSSARRLARAAGARANASRRASKPRPPAAIRGRHLAALTLAPRLLAQRPFFCPPRVRAAAAN